MTHNTSEDVHPEGGLELVDCELTRAVAVHVLEQFGELCDVNLSGVLLRLQDLLLVLDRTLDGGLTKDTRHDVEHRKVREGDVQHEE
eukprot:CAMPEP_0115335914 /NCGR_PEP_ID=MMETSP0270-20121206/88721_1 /TAXON_ID=71861 /ORGANISM="Scrippsiella trochoidea, Strain CCMP3099" /LENGTH=86 /DNA_ID=CAMNT_0002757041 /DNA_START=246 /DNA_END=507 /DNA_ORIENTATION=+